MREMVMIFLGVTTAGKSWFLICLTQSALLLRKRVLYLGAERRRGAETIVSGLVRAADA
jgi:hypothetical protein